MADLSPINPLPGTVSQPLNAGPWASRQPAYWGPRERINAQGPNALTDAELLAVCLRTGSAGVPVMALAEALLGAFGGLSGLARVSSAQLLGQPGMGPSKVATLLAARVLAERMLAAQLVSQDLLSDSQAVAAYLRLALGGMAQEVFACLFLDARHRLLSFDKLFYGSIDRATVHPRELLKRALTYNAASVILAHNHPSGVAEPSPSDIQLTAKLQGLLTQIDVRLLDHVVVAAGTSVSLAERGLL